MALSYFFRINLPYGIARNENDEWMAFNREYLPIGFSDKQNGFDIDISSSYPVHNAYKGLTVSS